MLSGTWFILPTPFTEDGRVDFESLRRLVETAGTWEVDGFTAMGVMGESSSLSDGERTQALEVIIEAAAPRPVAIGCSAPSTGVIVARAAEATRLGAAALMVSAPPLMTDVDLLPQLFDAVRASTELSVILQDDPQSTGVRIPLTVLVETVQRCGIAGVKLEDPPTALKIQRLLERCPDVAVFGGLGGLYALEELRRGAAGTMTGFAYPEILAEVRRRHEAGDFDGAALAFERYLPLIRYEAQPVVSLATRKELLKRRGVINAPITRGAIRSLDTTALQEIDGLLARLGIVPSSARIDVASGA